MNMKYVIVEFDGFSFPFTFPEIPNHFDVANALSSHRLGGKIISAGFCWFNENKNTWVCYGESVSLKMKSRPEDVKIFNNSFRID